MSENYSVEFNSIAFQEAMSLGLGETDCRKFMNKLSKDNIAQIVVLTSLQMSNGTPISICVVNTHLYSNHLRPDVKLWQSVSLMREIQMFLASRDYPLILCGDFNSEPDSAVHEFLLNGGIINSHDELQAENNKVQILPDLSELNHHIPFASAMSTAFGEEPLYTNYTANFKGTLDYIFYTPNSLRIMAAMAIPDERDVAIISGRGLPSACFASDHFALCCDIAVTGNGLSPSTSNGSPSLMGMNGNVYDTTFSLNGNSTGSGNSYSGQRVRSRTRR